MINLETPKKHKPLIGQAHQVAMNLLRPNSRKYDTLEHAYPIYTQGSGERAAQAIAALRPDLEIQPAPLLAERDWGIWEGAPRAMLDRDATPEGGESPAPTTARSFPTPRT